MVMQNQNTPSFQTLPVPMLSKQMTVKEQNRLTRLRERGAAMALVERVATSAITALLPTRIIASAGPEIRANHLSELAPIAVEVGVAVLKELYLKSDAIADISDAEVERVIAKRLAQNQEPTPEVTGATKAPIVIEAYN